MSENMELLRRVLACADRACSPRDPQDVLSSVVTTTRELLAARAAAVVQVDDRTGYLVIRAGDGLSRQFMRQFRRPVGTALLGEVIWNGREVVLEDVAPDSEQGRELMLEQPCRSVMCVRTVIDNRGTGYVLVEAAETGRFRADDVVVMRLLADIAALAMDRDRALSSVGDRETDHTSKVFSYGYFYRRLTEEIERARRLNERMSLLLLEVDGLKEYRQKSGPEPAARVFDDLVTEVQESMRSIDILGRYGPDQTVVYLPETNREAAMKAAERIRLMVQRSREKSEVEPPLTVSVGVATFPENGESTDQLLNALASALFKAQRAGRNRVSGPAETYIV